MDIIIAILLFLIPIGAIYATLILSKRIKKDKTVFQESGIGFVSHKTGESMDIGYIVIGVCFVIVELSIVTYFFSDILALFLAFASMATGGSSDPFSLNAIKLIVFTGFYLVLPAGFIILTWRRHRLLNQYLKIKKLKPNNEVSKIDD